MAKMDTFVPDNINTTNSQSMTRRQEFAREDISALQLVFGNFYVPTTTGEVSPGCARSVTASIEYLVGTYKQVTFCGSVTGSMADGQAQLVSDSTTDTIPKGSQYWVKTWTNCANAQLYGTAGAGQRGRQLHRGCDRRRHDDWCGQWRDHGCGTLFRLCDHRQRSKPGC